LVGHHGHRRPQLNPGHQSRPASDAATGTGSGETRQGALFDQIALELRLLVAGFQLPIANDAEGRPEIHYTRIYGAFRRWQAGGCFDITFTVVVLRLHQSSLLDVTIIHGDGTTTAAKKGGDNIGFNGHKKIKGDKVVAFCDRNCQCHRAVCRGSWGPQ
jgi:hypothetical protein